MVGNATMEQLFNQPVSAVYKVIQSLKTHKALLMWTTLPFISAVFCMSITVYHKLLDNFYSLSFREAELSGKDGSWSHKA